MNSRTLAAALTATAAAFSVAAGAAEISIDGNGATAQFFESPDSNLRFRTVGQVFEVPAPGNETRLTEFAFEFGGAPSGLDYRARVYAFDAMTGRPTGPALYTGPARQAGAAGETVETGLAVELQPGTPYIAFLTTQGVTNDATLGVILLANNGNPYPDGNSWRLESTSTVDTATTEDWTEISNFDLDFRAEFESADEADLGVTIVDGTDFVSEGDTVSYTLTVSNAGPRDISGAVIDAPLPTGLANGVWQCLPGAGATCTASGNGGLADAFDAVSGGSLNYVLAATVQNASEATGIVFSATLTPPASPPDPNAANNTAVDVNAVGLFANGFEGAP